MTGPFAHLAMYDLAEVRDAAQALWRAIAARLGPDAPGALSWPGAIEAACRDPDLVLGQTCGLPLVTALDGAVRVVGAFTYGDGASDAAAHYESVLVARERRVLAAFAGGTAAVNGWGSLSGWASLGASVPPEPVPFFGRVELTGAHVASVAAVREGRADLASIDAVTFALLRRHRTHDVDGLCVVGRGPRVPCLPLVTGLAADVDVLRRALAGAVRDPTTAAARRALLIESFVPLDAADYALVPALASVARRRLPPAPPT